MNLLEISGLEVAYGGHRVIRGVSPPVAGESRRLDEVFTLRPKLHDRQQQLAGTRSGGERRVGLGRGVPVQAGNLCNLPGGLIADVLLQILFSGQPPGACYAVSTIGLALVCGAMNRAEGAPRAVGGHVCLWGCRIWACPPR